MQLWTVWLPSIFLISFNETSFWSFCPLLFIIVHNQTTTEMWANPCYLKLHSAHYIFHRADHSLWQKHFNWVMCHKVYPLISGLFLAPHFDLMPGSSHIFITSILVFRHLGSLILCTMISVCKARWASWNEK